MKNFKSLHNRICTSPRMILKLKRKCNLLLLNKISLLVDSKNLEFVRTFNDLKFISTYIFDRLHGNDTTDETDEELLIKFRDTNAHDEILNNIDLRKITSSSYLISAYYISKALQSDSKQALVEEYLNKAKSLYDAEELNNSSYIKLRKLITNEYKHTLKDLKQVRNQIRDKIHLEILSPLKINGQHLLTFLSVFTSIYFCLSYIYLSNYLGAFGIKTSDYFYISDYLSTSLNSLEGVIISVLLSVIALIIGMTNRVNIEIDEVDTGRKQSSFFDIIFIAFFVLTIITSLLYYFFAGEIPSDLLSVNIFMIILILLSKAPIEKYFSNHMAIRVFCFVLVVSIFYVYDKSNRAIQNVLSKNGESSITVEYDGIALSDHELRHLVNTTDYSLYWCYAHKESIVVSKSKLRSIRIPRN